jgi:hypothetical protein
VGTTSGVCGLAVIVLASSMMESCAVIGADSGCADQYADVASEAVFGHPHGSSIGSLSLIGGTGLKLDRQFCEDG